jgi:hypothetical protein
VGSSPGHSFSCRNCSDALMGRAQVIGVDVASLEEVMQRANAAIQADEVSTVSMSLATQRRAVLEAVAFGSFLRDTESMVDLQYGLLTPLPSGSSGPGGGPGGGQPLLPS